MLTQLNNPRIIVQGLTGIEGRASLSGMINYGSNIVAGVTPAKGGQFVSGIPIFNSVKEATSSIGQTDVSVQFVPSVHTKNAVIEALESGIKYILIGAEKVPVQDSSIIFSLAKKYNATVIGPGSVGVISPHKKFKIGAIGGSNPDRVFSSGEIAIISKSGGMTSEIGLMLKNNNLGVSWAIGIGGEKIISTDYLDMLLELEQDESTRATVMFCELGGMYEEKVSRAVISGKIKKPVVAFISGNFSMTLPRGVQFGHAGAIIEDKYSSPLYKRSSLLAAGVAVADTLDDISLCIRQRLA